MPASLERFVQSIAGLGGRDGSGGGAVRHVAALALIGSLIGACTRASGPILANPPAPRPSIPVATEPPLPAASDPRHPAARRRTTRSTDRVVVLHRPPHRAGPRLPARPERYGFEFVIFRAERGAFPTSWASHLALTDEKGDRFHYAQRLEVGDGVDRRRATTTASERVRPGTDRSRPDRPVDPSSNAMVHVGPRAPTISRSPSTRRRRAAGPVPMAFDLGLRARKPPALHDRDGWIDFGREAVRITTRAPTWRPSAT